MLMLSPVRLDVPHLAAACRVSLVSHMEGLGIGFGPYFWMNALSMHPISLRLPPIPAAVIVTIAARTFHGLPVRRTVDLSWEDVCAVYLGS